MRIIVRYSCLLLLLGLSACSYFADQQSTQTALAVTVDAALWTETPTYTPTSTPTETLTPTPTRTPTPSLTPTPYPTLTPTATLIPVDVVIRELDEAAELVTIIVEEIIPVQVYAQENGYCGPFQLDPTKIQFSGEGSVRAGIDLKLIAKSDIQVSRQEAAQEVTIALPAPQIIVASATHSILDVTLPFDYVVCSADVKVSPDSLNGIEKAVSAAVLEAACNENVLEKANSTAKDVVYGLLQQLGFTTITINAQPVGDCP